MVRDEPSEGPALTSSRCTRVFALCRHQFSVQLVVDLHAIRHEDPISGARPVLAVRRIVAVVGDG